MMIFHCLLKMNCVILLLLLLIPIIKRESGNITAEEHRAILKLNELDRAFCKAAINAVMVKVNDGKILPPCFTNQN